MLPVKPAEISVTHELAMRAWVVMGGLDWTALPVVVEMFGVMDVEAFVSDLLAIRDWKQKQQEAQ